MTRAKFYCGSSENVGQPTDTTRKYVFTAVTGDGVPEDESYHRYTPNGRLELCVDNPAVEFEVGASYYLDFTKAD